MDPAWGLSPNQKLGFMNTNKEKLSVIIAYIHLNIGLVCKLLNKIYFKKWIQIIFDVFTGFIIFASIVGVMIMLIYLKWWYPVDAYVVWTPEELPAQCDGNAGNPANVCTSLSVISVTINNFMQVINTPTPKSLYWWSGQQAVANTLVIGAVICIPLMLCAIPIIVGCCSKKHPVHEAEMEPSDDGDRLGGEQEALIDHNKHNAIKEIHDMLDCEKRQTGSHGGETFGDAFIWQMVETIEFVLGTVSSTASYLRLWALSLAHGQLGEVFMSMCFTQLPTMAGKKLKDFSTGLLIPYLYLSGFVYMTAVTGVLLGMDLLEVFLHTLRLHWVEFMKQFFEGAGYEYTPFSFNKVFEDERDRQD